MKKSIIIHEDTSALFETLGDAEAGQLLKAMLAYQNNRPVEVDGTLGAIFAMLKVGMDKDNAAYDKKCEKNRENIRKRWNTDEYENIPEDTNVYERIRTDTQEDIQEDLQVSEIPSKKRARAKFTPPTVEEVAEYVKARGSDVDPEAFVSYYKAQGWLLSNGRKMVDWEASVRRWERKEPHGKPPAPPGKIRQTYTPFIERKDDDLDALQRELARKARSG